MPRLRVSWSIFASSCCHLKHYIISISFCFSISTSMVQNIILFRFLFVFLSPQVWYKTLYYFDFFLFFYLHKYGTKHYIISISFCFSISTSMGTKHYIISISFCFSISTSMVQNIILFRFLFVFLSPQVWYKTLYYFDFFLFFYLHKYGTKHYIISISFCFSISTSMVQNIILFRFLFVFLSPQVWYKVSNYLSLSSSPYSGQSSAMLFRNNILS